LEALNEASTCVAAGLRLLAPERPGCGLSDPLPGRRLLNWPADLAAFADALCLDRFALMGVSGGAPYALACAREIPERITALALVSPCGPSIAAGALQGVAPVHRLMWRLAPLRPRTARALARLLLSMIDRFPGLMLATSAGKMCPADREALRVAPSQVGHMRMLVESARQGVAGPVEDFRLLASPWGFEPEEITMPVKIWHGDADSTIPLRHAEELASRIPNAELVVCPGEGHFLLAARMPEIIAQLLN
jgi:pimeloyl-ACP methyl ester carboxylesterase